MDKGLFIVFEGVDACGKSTQIKNLQKVLESPKAIEMFATKEIEVQKEKVDNFSTSIKQEQIKLDKQLRLEY